MLKKSGTNVSRRQFLAAASSVAVASSVASTKGSSFAQSAPAPAPDHLVTIDIVTTPNKISYWVGNPPKDASSLQVKSGESVMWQAKTHGPSHRLTILFVKNTPFTDTGGGAVYAFEGSETDELKGIGGNIGQVPSYTYKYSVAVFDHATHQTHTDDPKIIVGKGDGAREQLDLALEDLKNTDAKLSGKPNEQKQLKSIERELEHLIDELK